MIISQWTAKSDDCPDCGDPWCMGCSFNVQADASRTDRVEIDELPPLDGDEYAVTLDADMLAALNAEREEHARFGCETHSNLQGC